MILYGLGSLLLLIKSKYFLTENFRNDMQRRVIRKIRFIMRGDIYEEDFEKNFKENFKENFEKTNKEAL
jgi:hypothetical protein